MINVAVTGATGFVGKHLLRRSSSQFVFHPLTLGQLEFKKEITFGPFNIDHVIHLAAKTYVPDSWVMPHEFYEINVMGTQRVLDFCRTQKCSLTYVSSYVYGKPEYLPIDEDHRVIPNTPYNHSKLMGEELCAFYNRVFDVNVAILRPFNLYGPDQNLLFLIPKIIRQASSEGCINLESLTPKRDYLYISDFLDLLIATFGHQGCSIYNAGSGSSYSVKELVKIILKIMKKEDIPIESAEKHRENEVMDVIASIDKAQKAFNWTPKIGIVEGLTKTINWNE